MLFQFAPGTNFFASWLVWLLVLAGLFFFNEVGRRYKYAGFALFFILPVVMSILWFTVLSETTYTDWFHMAKVYSAIAASIGFWCIRFVGSKNGRRLADTKFALYFPPLILALNILQAVVRDFEIGRKYYGMAPTFDADAGAMVLGGSWNYFNGIAGILNIIIITGWVGICLKKKTAKDKSQDMLWPDMLWFYIFAYNIWNFAYTYNALPHHSWYCGFALLLAPTICAFTTGKGAWVQHRGQTLAIWCMFAQTFPAFQDEGMWRVDSTYNPNIYFALGLFALLSNAAVVVYMVYKWKKTGRNPYKGEVFSDLKAYQEIKALAE
jgi:hypothetical protein